MEVIFSPRIKSADWNWVCWNRTNRTHPPDSCYHSTVRSDCYGTLSILWGRVVHIWKCGIYIFYLCGVVVELFQKMHAPFTLSSSVCVPSHIPLSSRCLLFCFPCYRLSYMLFYTRTHKPINDPKSFMRWMLRKTSLYDGIDD